MNTFSNAGVIDDVVVTPIPENIDVENSSTAISQQMDGGADISVDITPDPTDIEVEGANGKRIVFFCNGEQYIFNFILKKDDPNSRWLNIAMSGDEYIVEWNIRHMFFKPYINDEHFLTIMEQFTFALALSEIEAMRLSVDGKIDPSSIRMKMNDTLQGCNYGGTLMNDSIGMNYCAPDANVWAVNLDGRYMSAVQNYLVADGIPTDGVTKIVSNAAQTLSYCPDPEGIGKCQKTGIVIGKVQSGKTSNFISITALAFDNDYDIVIVLGGTKKPLVKQNRDRIKEYFSTTKDVLVLDTTDFKDQLTAQKMHQFRKMNKKVVIVALKSPAQINYIADNIFFDSVLAEKPILIIDDEGDEASLNTLVKKGKKSSTYKAIENLKERLDRHCFLSITATPQANLLIDTLDVLSPDFGILVDPGKGYCGLGCVS